MYKNFLNYCNFFIINKHYHPKKKKTTQEKKQHNTHKTKPFFLMTEWVLFPLDYI